MRTATITKPDFIPHEGVAKSYPAISIAELESRSLTIDESEKQITELIHDFYHPKA
jgi:hypothetical protein